MPTTKPTAPVLLSQIIAMMRQRHGLVFDQEGHVKKNRLRQKHGFLFSQVFELRQKSREGSALFAAFAKLSHLFPQQASHGLALFGAVLLLSSFLAARDRFHKFLFVHAATKIRLASATAPILHRAPACCTTRRVLLFATEDRRPGKHWTSCLRAARNRLLDFHANLLHEHATSSFLAALRANAASPIWALLRQIQAKALGRPTRKRSIKNNEIACGA